MKIIAVDADTGELNQLENSLKAVFTKAQIVTFDNALNSFKYCLNNAQEAAIIFFPLTIRPFDGFKYSLLLKESSFFGDLILTTHADNAEMRELISLNGGNRYIQKPITPEKMQKLAMLEQEVCLADYDDEEKGRCTDCIYHWCEKYRAPANCKA